MKYSYMTYGKPGRWYAAVAKLVPRKYGKHTAHGARTVMKPDRWLELPERFTERTMAVAAAKREIERRTSL